MGSHEEFNFTGIMNEEFFQARLRTNQVSFVNGSLSTRKDDKSMKKRFGFSFVV